jgi:hypothetical protein
VQAQRTQQLQKDGGAGDAVHVVVAKDRDLLVSTQSPHDAIKCVL